MLLKDVSAPYESHKIIHYSYSTLNKVVRHIYQMQPIGGNLYKGEITKDEYGAKHCDIFAVYPEVPYGILLYKNERIWDDEADKMVDYYLETARNQKLDTFSNFMSRLRTDMEAGKFIGGVEIAFAMQTDPQLAKELSEHREAYRAKQEERYAAERAKREAEDQAYVNERNEETQKVITEAVDILRNGGTLSNKDITVYRNRYDSSTYSIINHLARLYGVKIPLRTQGWINSTLTAITVQDGKMTTGRMVHGRSQSTVIFKYMNQLIEAVRNNPAPVSK